MGYGSLKMQDQPRLKDVEEVLARLDRSWQEIVQPLQDGQGKPSTQRFQPGEAAFQDAGCDHQEENLNAGAAPCNSAPTPKPAESTLEQLSPKGRKQKFFNISVLALLVVILGGLAFLIAQTQLGRGRVDAGMLIIRMKDGVQRAMLSELDGQMSLCLLDNNGKTRVKAFFDSSGNPIICLLDELQQNLAEIKMGAGRKPLLRPDKEPASPSASAETQKKDSGYKIPIPDQTIK